MPTFNLAVLGATGMVGRAMLSILEERAFPVASLHLLASHRSAGESLAFGGQDHRVLDVEGFDFSQVDVALFSAGGAASARYAPLAADAGCVVIDNSSQFRYEKGIPLVIPEVNGDLLKSDQRYQLASGAGAIIANPNCSTIQMIMALKPIHDAVGWSRLNIATYQAVSGAGQAAVQGLREESLAVLKGAEPMSEPVLGEPIAFNVMPKIDVWQDNGYTKEEMKMVWETQKILDDESILVNPTAVRVPVFNGHSVAIHGETREKITASDACALLDKAPGVQCMTGEDFPMPLREGDGRNDVYVGRVREDLSHPHGLNLWVVGDNLRKGAALNAVQIAELLSA